jgi:hypothetical protein
MIITFEYSVTGDCEEVLFATFDFFLTYYSLDLVYESEVFTDIDLLVDMEVPLKYRMNDYICRLRGSG